MKAIRASQGGELLRRRHNEHCNPEIRDLRTDTAAVGRPLAHDSAAKHVTGTAIYIDDAASRRGCCISPPGFPAKAKGRILSMDLSAVRAAPGVVEVLTASDIPGLNDCSPSIGGDPILADGEVLFHGQVLFCVLARTRDEARRAARLGKIEIEVEKPVVTAAQGLEKGLQVLDPYSFGRGDPAATMAQSAHVVEGSMQVGGQEHFYLEGQIATAIPGEGGEMNVFSSTQHPSEVQHLVARMLGRPDAMTVRVPAHGRRLWRQGKPGGAMGLPAALAAHVTGKPSKIRLDRDDDFITTGKRHDFDID